MATPTMLARVVIFTVFSVTVIGYAPPRNLLHLLTSIITRICILFIWRATPTGPNLFLSSRKFILVVQKSSLVALADHDSNGSPASSFPRVRHTKGEKSERLSVGKMLMVLHRTFSRRGCFGRRRRRRLNEKLLILHRDLWLVYEFVLYCTSQRH